MATNDQKSRVGDARKQLLDFLKTPAGRLSTDDQRVFGEAVKPNQSRDGAPQNPDTMPLRDRPRRARNLSPLPAGTTASSLSRDTPSAQPVLSSADLGRMVHEARRAMGLSEQSFADLAGVGRRFLREVEIGKQTLEFGKVLVVCKAAGIDLMARRR